MFSIAYNRTTNHIAGIAERTQGSEFNYAQSACGSLTRSRLAAGKSFESLGDALKAARTAGGRRLCKTCEKAAVAALEATQATPEVAPLPEGVTEVDGKLYGDVKELRWMVTKRIARLRPLVGLRPSGACASVSMCALMVSPTTKGHTMKITTAQETTLRTIEANGGEMDGYAGQKGFRVASIAPLSAAGLVEKLGTKRNAEDTEYVWYNRVRITEAGRAWLAGK